MEVRVGLPVRMRPSALALDSGCHSGEGVPCGHDMRVEPRVEFGVVVAQV
jgi:hypothetical protein